MSSPRLAPQGIHPFRADYGHQEHQERPDYLQVPRNMPPGQDLTDYGQNTGGNRGAQSEGRQEAETRSQGQEKTGKNQDNRQYGYTQQECRHRADPDSDAGDSPDAGGAVKGAGIEPTPARSARRIVAARWARSRVSRGANTRLKATNFASHTA